LGPLVGQLDAQRQTIERQADRVAELERENGRQSVELERAASTVEALSKENDALRASHSPVASILTPDPAPLTVESPGARLRRLAPWLLLAAILLLALVVGWPLAR
jgi:hypothetical protein